ncbi:hypothetical protein QO259_01055 [Salinicola sp. JS01]|uniref:hypothetical protein n=1 Tax=Salinicola sp. JS01 TaxID=3050071 RepID=UPI00255C198A|nr:hypothetical protein [Salinicola sp. JS01]WIX33276.1 hypothetical protein QO259_01055 [Salinicola sp. JS01]
MQGQSAFLPRIQELSDADGWNSVHRYLPLEPKATLQVVYQDIHGGGATSAYCEQGRFISTTNRAPVRGVRVWKYHD